MSIPAELLALGLDVCDNLLAEGDWVDIDVHDGAERLLRVALEEVLDLRRSLDRRLDAVIGVDAEQAESQRGVEALLVRPLRTRESVRHVLDGLASDGRDAAEDGRGARVVDALADMPDGRQIVRLEESLQ